MKQENNGEIFESRLFNKISNYMDNYDIKYIKKSFITVYENLIKDYRYMDIDHNSYYLDSMIESIKYLAIYLVLKQYLQLNQIVDIIHSFYEEKLNSMDSLILEKTGKQIFAKDNIELIKKNALKSQENKFSEDYIVYYVEGDGKKYDFGNDTKQCPIHLFFKKHNSIDFLKCICDIDFLRSKYLKSGLFREKCLCNGDDCCTFRWKQH